MLPIDIELRKAGPEEMLKKHLDAIPANEPDDFTRLQKDNRSAWRRRRQTSLLHKKNKKIIMTGNVPVQSAIRWMHWCSRKISFERNVKEAIVMWAPIRSSRFFQRVRISCNLLPTQRW